MAEEDPQATARAAAAGTAVDEVREGMTIGLGSGRAVEAVIEAIVERWPEGPPVRAAVAAEQTEETARSSGLEVIELDGSSRLDVVIDGADEFDAELNLVKGGGGALLREKLLFAACDRFVVVVEDEKRVGRLGETRRLPVEIVRFAWQDTRGRVEEILEEPSLRETDSGEPFVTDEGHFLLDCVLPSSADLSHVAERVKQITGVVEHGLFLNAADAVLVGRGDGGVETLTP
ncbi:MAG: ribose-5-phosphate isomerase RpiA [Actinomycetota bacterium]|nr:ribose-5-phosphate isomerase RpiA [Actinomycetota bacterium]